MVAGDQPPHRGDEIVDEATPGLRGGEPDFGVQRQGGQAFPTSASLGVECRDSADGIGRGANQGPNAGSIGTAFRQPGGAEDLGTDHKGASGGSDHPFEAVASPALLHQLDQPFFLQQAEMVVDSLSRDLEPTGEAGGGVWLRQGLEQGPARAGEEDPGSVGAANDLERCGE